MVKFRPTQMAACQSQRTSTFSTSPGFPERSPRDGSTKAATINVRLRVSVTVRLGPLANAMTADDAYRQGRETSDQFRARLTNLLPNFPEEVLSQWVFENGGVLQKDFAWFNPVSASFQKSLWATERIVSEIRHWHEEGVEMEVRKVLDGNYRPGYRLLRYMRENGTWPVAPVVYDNAHALSIQRGGGASRYVMLEGMHRLGFFRALASSRPETLRASHRLWLVSHP